MCIPGALGIVGYVPKLILDSFVTQRTVLQHMLELISFDSLAKTSRFCEQMHKESYNHTYPEPGLDSKATGTLKADSRTRLSRHAS